MLSSRFAGIPISSSTIDGGVCRSCRTAGSKQCGRDRLRRPASFRNGGRDQIGTVADIKSVWAAGLNRNSQLAKLRERGNLSATRLLHLAHPLRTYVRSNKSAIINYGARYRSGRRIATALAESGVNSLVARRMVKKQQMQWSKRGAHLLLQVRAAVLNGDLRERLAYKPPKQANRSRIARLFEPTPPLLKTA